MKGVLGKIVLIVVGLCCFADGSVAQTALQSKQYQAFLSGGYEMWAKIVAEQEHSVDRQKLPELITLADCYYVYASELLNHKENEKAKNVIEKAECLLDEALKKHPKNALLLNYRGVFYSYHVALNKLKLSSGKKALECINRALALEPNNVQILLDKGNSLYYVPKVLGGDKLEALGYYRKAIRLIEQQKNTSHNWKYLQLLFLEAHCLDLLGDYTQAEKVYLKALRVEPRFKTAKTYYTKMLKKK